jgi:hypothetical protein
VSGGGRGKERIQSEALLKLYYLQKAPASHQTGLRCCPERRVCFQDIAEIGTRSKQWEPLSEPSDYLKPKTIRGSLRANPSIYVGKTFYYLLSAERKTRMNRHFEMSIQLCRGWRPHLGHDLLVFPLLLKYVPQLADLGRRNQIRVNGGAWSLRIGREM